MLHTHTHMKVASGKVPHNSLSNLILGLLPSTFALVLFLYSLPKCDFVFYDFTYIYNSVKNCTRSGWEHVVYYSLFGGLCSQEKVLGRYSETFKS